MTSRRWFSLSVFCLVTLGFALSGGRIPAQEAKAPKLPPAADRKVDFVRDVRPLLKKHCLQCHGAERQESGLRLDRGRDALAGGDSGRAIVPGKSAESRLVQYIAGIDPDVTMPPEGYDKLSDEQVGLIRAWIDQGAEWPESADLTQDTRSDHWSFQPIRRPAVPSVPGGQDWIRSPIDAFVLARLRKEGIEPSSEADRYTLIRRLSLDLLGLPPTPDDIERFISDTSPDAYETLVDGLLRSPHFGERWGRHWLDKARYADSDGYEKDRPRMNAWRYRDWVIEAINSDMPFDEFTIQQLAGDLLPDATAKQKLATAFHRQTLTNTEGGTDQEEFRVEAVFDRVETTGTVWLGLTIGCARCHSHKYDPILQREYYQLFAFFNNGDEVNTQIAKSEQAVKRYKAENPKYEAALKELEKSLQSAVAEAAESDDAVPEEVRKILDAAPEKRSKKQLDRLREYLKEHNADAVSLVEELAQLQKKAPASPYMSVRVIGQRTKNPRQTHVLRRGDFLQPTTPVQPDTPEVLHALKPRKKDAPPDRLDLARWLMAPENPLTARVAVNHIWDYLFGRPLVETMNDFGSRGEVPTHPKLLDWLATEYRRLGWSRKAMIKAIVLSSTYRQSSAHRRGLREVDPQNRLLYRQNRFRVEAETVRDLYLAASGLLSRKIGGPSVFPPMPPDVAALSYANNFKWNQSRGEDRYRRGMYTFFKRTAPHPNLTAFDCPDANTTRVDRNTSNTPLQALTTLNNEVFVEAAQALGKRILTADLASDADRIDYGFRLCVARPPSDMETQEFRDLLEASRDWYGKREEAARQLIGRHAAPGIEPDENAAWVVAARVMLNMDEFITRE